MNQVVGRAYCTEHEAEAQAKLTQQRGTPTQRGYDAQHYREAKAAKALAIANRALCPRCLRPILAGQALDYGHATPLAVDKASRADHVEHAHCNRSAQHYR